MSLQSHELPRASDQINRLLPTAATEAKRILIIDDDPDLRLGLHIRLRANNYETCFAEDAESAIRVALAKMPDLIILDLGLPDDDGYVVMKMLSEHPEVAAVPVIVVTGRDRYTHEDRVREAGAKRFFEKPVEDSCLLMAIRQLLD